MKKKRLISILLAAAMLLGLLPTAALAANESGSGGVTNPALLADEAVPDEVSGGINGYMAGLTADGVTNLQEKYEAAFTGNSIPTGAATVTIDEKTRSAALNGKIWADKTVTENKTDGKSVGTFDVTLSALGQTWADTVTTTTSVAFDVVFVVDVSLSMGYPLSNASTVSKTGDYATNAADTRLYATANALEAAASKLLDGNENNRIGVVAFGASATTMVPLANYQRSGNTNFFAYSNHSVNYNSLSGNLTFTYSGSNSPISQGYAKGNYGDLNSGTSQQAGIAQAGSVLTANSNTLPISENVTKRIPVVILLTDGEPNHGSASYNAAASSMTGSVYGVNAYYYVVQTAAYQKNAIQSFYRTKQSNDASINAMFYSIGIGMDNTDDSNAKVMLNPASRTDKTTLTGNTLSAKINADGTGLNLEYADDAYIGQMTETELTEAFQSIVDNLSGETVAVGVGEETGQRDKMTFVETLGDHVEITDGVTLKVPVSTTTTDEATGTTTTTEVIRTYTLQPTSDGANTLEWGAVENTVSSMAGNSITLKATKVKVGEIETYGDLTEDNLYDQAAAGMHATLTKLSSGQWQLEISIPPQLMAYNVLSTTTENGVETNTYTTSSPVQITYTAGLDSEATAGTYNIGALANCYLTFAPSSQQSDGTNYDMPYYWEDATRNAAIGDVKKTQNDTNTAEYVTRTNIDANHMVYVYLGNNGKYELNGKDVTIDVHWNDDLDVDNQRPTEIYATIYKEAYTATAIAAPTSVPTFAESDKLQTVKLSMSNLTDDINLWTATVPNEQVYAPNNQYYRYWVRFTADETGTQEIANYAIALNNENVTAAASHKNGYAVPGNSTYFCTQTLGGTAGTDNKGDTKLCVELTNDREMVDYTIIKTWDASVTNQPASVQVKLYANGQALSANDDILKNIIVVDQNGTKIENQQAVLSATDGVITITKTGNDWPTISLRVPRNMHSQGSGASALGGVTVLYTPVEVTDGYTPVTTYETVRDATNETIITGYKATITNYSSVDHTSLTVVKTWDDNEDQDGLRSQVTNLTFTLTATANGTTLTDEQLTSLGATTLTQTMTKTDGGWPDVTWSGLSRKITIDGTEYPVSYSAVESKIGTVDVSNNTETTTNVTTGTADVNNDNQNDYAVTYSTGVPGYVFVTNTHTPATMNLTIAADWNDNYDQDGIRPTSGVSGGLYKKVGDGAIEFVRTWSTMNVAGDTDVNSITINDLPVYEKGNQITYYVSQDKVNGYTVTKYDDTAVTDEVTQYPVAVTTTDGVTSGSITLTNTHPLATDPYKVAIEWQDNDNRDNVRPTTLTVTITKPKSGTETADTKYTVQLTVNNDGTLSVDNEHSTLNCATAAIDDGQLVITGLPKYEKINGEGGNLIDYTADLSLVEKYTKTIDAYGYSYDSFVLTHVADPITLTLTKTWTGDEGHTGQRPSAANYRGYLTLTRSWPVDGETTSETVNVYPTVTANGNAYTVTWTGLEKYVKDTAQTYTYSVAESDVPNYNGEGTVEFAADTTTGELKATLTNTYSQEVYETITVTKVWNDDSDNNHLRPAFPTNYGVADATKDTTDPLGMTLSDGTTNYTPSSITKVEGDANKWIYTWSNVPKYDANGNWISYFTASETAFSDYYEPGTATILGGGAMTGLLTNSLKSESVPTGTLVLEKVWQGDKDTERPESVQFYLYGVTKDATAANASLITMTKTEDGQLDVTNSSREGVHIDGTVNGSKWSATITGLPLYSSGNDIEYYVLESNPDAHYTVSYTNRNAQRTVPDATRGELVVLKTGVTGEACTTLTVTNDYIKTLTYDPNGGIWVDGKVPAVQTFNSTQVQTNVNVNGTTAMNNPGAVFLGWCTEPLELITNENALAGKTLLQKDQEIKLTEAHTILYAVWAQDADGTGEADYNETSVTVEITWADANNQDGIRPASVTVQLLGGTETKTATLDLTDGTHVIVNETGTTWSYTWTGLPKDKTYTVQETKGGGYAVSNGAFETGRTGQTYTVSTNQATVTNGTATITNTHTPEKVSYTVTKVWDHTQNTDDEPTDCTAEVKLWGDGDPVKDENGVELTATLKDTTTYTWNALPKYKSGHLITYHAIETAAESSLTKANKGRYSVSYDWGTTETKITNTYGQNRNITVLYTWNDGGSSLRPNSVKVRLMRKTANGNYVSAEREDLPLTPEGWTNHWTDVPVQNTDGSKIEYAVAVVEVNGTPVDNMNETSTELSTTNYSYNYTTIGPDDGVIVMNSALQPAATTDITVNKTWEKPNSMATPAAVYVQLYSQAGENGAKKLEQTLTLTADTNPQWATTISGLPTKDNDGNNIAYSVEEIPVPGYTTDANGYNITNTVDGYSGEQVRVKFLYVNASATDSEDKAITQGEEILLDYGSSYEFTPKANSGYFLTSTQITVGEKANLLVLKDGKYMLTGILEDITVTITAVQQSISGGGTVSPVLNTEDHYSYIIGYQDGTVRPGGNITRAEVATIFFRLLTDEARSQYWCQTNDYSDVAPRAWYNNAVSTLSNMGILNGFEDGTFRPNDPVTRAQFTKIAVGFFETAQKDYQGYFPDVAEGRWYTTFVEAAVEAGLIQGFNDGTFRPNENLTRAQACTIVNRVLGRKPAQDLLLEQEEMVTWPDNQPGSWYYLDVQEATNSHDYIWTTQKGEKVEEWSAKLAQRDWAALEKAWAHDNSAPGGQVVQ